MTGEVNETVRFAEMRQMAKHLQTTLQGSLPLELVSLIQPDRFLILESRCTVDNGTKPTQIYLFNDMILFVRNGKYKGHIILNRTPLPMYLRLFIYFL